ncbi:hypothetical protein, partial [Sphingomonas xinjiangensis]
MTNTEGGAKDKEAAADAPLDGREHREGSAPLLGLTPQTSPGLEKAGQNLTLSADLDIPPRHTPLLGTI